MFENLTQRLSKTLRNIRVSNVLTEKKLKDVLKEVKVALLEADVALPVVLDFIKHVKNKSIGYKIGKTLTPSQEFIRIVHKELVLTMGKEHSELLLSVKPPAVILVSGLQGTGKTTTVSKIGYFLKKRNSKKVLTVSTDIHRPAAIKQLENLALKANIGFFDSQITQTPESIVNAALKEARLKFYDVVIVDTAGRNYLNKKMMEEIVKIHRVSNPVETLFVIDAMMGQDISKAAKIFNTAVPITGVVITKIDGDSRGGSALSVRHTIGKPIKFLGTGEKNSALEIFHPDRIASRILGMGDVLSLIEDFENTTSHSDKNIKEKKTFDLNDVLDHLHQIKKIGGASSIIQKLPDIGISQNIKSRIPNEVIFIKMEAIINSMTLKERSNPKIIKNSRRRRISNGCGIKIQEVTHLLNQLEDMRNMMQKIKQNGITKILNNMKNMFPKTML